MNIQIQVFTFISILVEYGLYYGKFCLIFWGTANLLSKVAALIYKPTKNEAPISEQSQQYQMYTTLSA